MDLKVALAEHDVILDDQIDDFKSRIGAADGNIQAMQTQGASLKS